MSEIKMETRRWSEENLRRRTSGLERRLFWSQLCIIGLAGTLILNGYTDYQQSSAIKQLNAKSTRATINQLGDELEEFTKEKGIPFKRFDK